MVRGGTAVRLTLRASGPASAAVAWRRYADLDAWATWSPQIDAAETCSGARSLAAGLTGTVTGLPLAGRPLLSVGFVVEGVDAPAMTWSWRVRPTRVAVDLPPWLGCPTALHLEHEVVATPGGSATVLRMDGRAPVVLGYALPALVALRRLVRPLTTEHRR